MQLEKREEIAHLVVRVLKGRFSTFPEDAISNRNAPFHEAFLNAFTNQLADKVLDIPYLISLSSWLHGLNTTMGQTFFEGVGYILSEGRKREFTTTSGTQLEWLPSHQLIVNEHYNALRNSLIRPTNEIYNDFIIIPNEEAKGAPNFTVDVFFEDSDVVHCLEMKTVKPNSGTMGGEKLKILQARASLMMKYPGKRIEYYLGFPFDPTSDTDMGYNKVRFLNSIIDGTKYFSPPEILLAGEMWDYLSGHSNTMEMILDIINRIATPDFEKEFNFLNNNDMRANEPIKYLEIAQRWQLYSEVDFLKNDKELLTKLSSKSYKRTYDKPPFNTKGEYDSKRQNLLKNLLQSDQNILL